MATIPSLSDVALRGKRVLVREDLNVPIEDGRVTGMARINAALPTLRRCLDAGAAVLVVSHLGRPEEGRRDPSLSLEPVAGALGEALGHEVRFETDWHDGVQVAPGEVVLLENIRFEPGETTNDPALAARLAALCDVFVLDAFGTAHRAHASTAGVALAAPVACAGPLLEAELSALDQALDDPARPLVAIVGGSKVSTKLDVLESLASIADTVIVGGGIANTFLLAAGDEIGASLAEPEQVDVARRIMAKVDVPMPVDLMTAPELDAAQPARLRPRGEVPSGESILDIGPETARRFQSVVRDARTIIWNGPLGVFEFDQFGEGTRLVAEAVAASSAFSVAGGGDTLAAIEKYDVGEGISYQSTGGGAFLEVVAGETLPAVAALNSASSSAR
ncbi:MAG: phosphoglycerate kinase [Gammaproteobacteria bacterium]|nr:phosphoglycerate kinase [Gammaproteobacteria bacterium]